MEERDLEVMKSFEEGNKMGFYDYCKSKY